MITSTTRFWARCDHMHYDSAVLSVEELWTSAVAGSLGCHVEAGPFHSERAVTDSLLAAGWFLRVIPPRPGQNSGTWLACPMHAPEADNFWMKVDSRKATEAVEPQ
jgi:hypothetical protein